MTGTETLAAHAHFVHWGVLQISLPNLLVIVTMIVIFALALVVPFPGGHDETPAAAGPDAKDVPSHD